MANEQGLEKMMLRSVEIHLRVCVGHVWCRENGSGNIQRTKAEN